MTSMVPLVPLFPVRPAACSVPGPGPQRRGTPGQAQPAGQWEELGPWRRWRVSPARHGDGADHRGLAGELGQWTRQRGLQRGHCLVVPSTTASDPPATFPSSHLTSGRALRQHPPSATHVSDPGVTRAGRNTEPRPGHIRTVNLAAAMRAGREGAGGPHVL